MLKAIPRFAVENPMVMIPIFLVLIGAGIVTYRRLPLQLQPYLENPTVGIIINYPGVSAEDMELYFARPIEQKMTVLAGKTFIRSTSQAGRTEIIIGFEYGSDMTKHKVEVETMLTNVMNELPLSSSNATFPWVVHVANDNVPTLDLWVERDGYNDVRLREFLDNTVRNYLEMTPGVQSILVYGGKRRQIQIVVDRNKLFAHHLGLMDIKNAVDEQDISLAAGELRAPSYDVLVRANERFKNPRDMLNIPLVTEENRTIYLRDVATVKDTYSEVTSAYHLNGKPGILVSLIKQPEVGDKVPIDAVLAKMNQLVQNYPGLHYSIAFNNLDFLQRIIDNAWKEMFLAFLITTFVVLAFLNDLRPTFIVLVTLPAAISAGFIFWHPFGFTVNTPTLMGITFTIGRLVDDSVIMMEVIDRHLRMGKSPRQAAIEGAQEVSGAMVAIGLSSWVAMGPALFLGGTMGTGFQGMTAPMIFANLMSTSFSLTLTPMLFAYLVRPRTAETKTLIDYADIGLTFLMRPFTWLWQKAEWLHLIGLNWALEHRVLVLAIAVATLYAGWAVWPTLGWEGMPLQDTGEAVGEVEMWPGTSFEDTQKAVSHIEKELLRNPEIKLVSTQIGNEPSLGTAPNTTYFGGYGVRTLNMADFKLTLTPTDTRDCQFYNQWADHFTPLSWVFTPCDERSGRTIWTILDTTQAQILHTVPDIRSLWFMEMGATPVNSARAPVEGIIKGDDLKVISQLGEQGLQVAERTPGLVQPFTSWSLTFPEYHLNIDRTRAHQLGLTVPQIAMQAYYALNGGMTGVFFDPTDLYRHSRYLIRYQPGQRLTPEDIGQVELKTPSGKFVPLKELATLDRRDGTEVVYKEDLKYAISVMAQYREVGLKMATAGLIMGMKTTLPLPKGYTVEPKGMMLDMLDNIYRLYNGLYLSVGILFILLLLQTRSMVSTLAIMTEAPLEWMGAIFFLHYRDFHWSPPVLWGFMLATVMVMATGILLIDKLVQTREAGVDRRRAVLTAGPIRLRPVLMTAMTAAAAFIPPAFAPPTGMDRFRPIASVLVGALISSTTLGLIIVPTFYTILDDAAQFLRKVYTGKPMERELSAEEFVARLPQLPTEVLWEMRQVDHYKPGVYGFDASLITPVLEEKERAERQALGLEEPEQATAAAGS